MHVSSIEAKAVRHACTSHELVPDRCRAGHFGFRQAAARWAHGGAASTVIFDRAPALARRDPAARRDARQGLFSIARHRRAERAGDTQAALTDAELSISAETAGIEVLPGGQGGPTEACARSRSLADLPSDARRGRSRHRPATAVRRCSPPTPPAGYSRSPSPLHCARRQGACAAGAARPITPDMPALDADLRIAGARLPIDRTEV
jgi:hypothetical protein